MITKINIKKIFIYLFVLLVVLPYFSSNVGITFGGIKVNIADIIIFIYILSNFLRKKNYSKFCESNSEIVSWKWLLLAFIIFIPIGILNGAHFEEQVRLIRNLLYAIVSFYILVENRENINDIFLMEYIAIISSLDCIIQTTFLHNNSNWYQFYRANGILNVFLFCFLIFRIWNMNKKEALVGIICCIGLIYSSFISQERTQLLTIGIAIIVSLFYHIYLKLNNLKEIKFNIKHILKIIIIIVICSITIYYVLQIDFVKNYIDYYFTYRLDNGNLFKSDILVNDGSFAGRLHQIKTIFNDDFNILYILCGRGTCAHYMALQGDTYIVDGAVLWTFKDLGIIGILILINIFCNMLKGFKGITKKSKLALYSSSISLIIFSLYNPSFIYTSSAAFTFGLYSFLKYNSIKENINNER